jgi:AAA+ superfamily predicted ATPase
MVTQNVKSFFLNEIDGLVQNQGVLTIATTNHPERIDDAILNRPSRFDVKYDFALPNQSLRKQFAFKWIKKSRKSASEVENLFARSDDEAIAGDIAKRTEGWSFAFLKEL